MSNHIKEQNGVKKDKSRKVKVTGIAGFAGIVFPTSYCAPNVTGLSRKFFSKKHLAASLYIYPVFIVFLQKLQT